MLSFHVPLLKTSGDYLMADDDPKGSELRRHARISWGFLVRHKPQGEQEARTELSTIRDISIGGCYFASQRPYPLGQILDLSVKLPGLKDPLVFQGEVKRSSPGGETPGMWFIGVEFVNIDGAKKDEFTQVISFFLKKQAKKKS